MVNTWWSGIDRTEESSNCQMQITFIYFSINIFRKGISPTDLIKLPVGLPNGRVVTAVGRRPYVGDHGHQVVVHRLVNAGR